MAGGEAIKSGTWQNEADKDPHVVVIASEEDLARLKEKKDEGIIVVHGNGDFLRHPEYVARFVRTDCMSVLPLVYVENDPVSIWGRVRFFDEGGDALISREEKDMLPSVLASIQRRGRLLAESREIIKPFEGFELDPRQSKLHVKGHLVDITAFEFKLISLLAKHYPREVTREEITEKLHFGVNRTSNVANQLINRLREKIVPFGIVTTKGTYRLSEKPDLKYQKRLRGLDEEGNELIALDKIDLSILEKALKGISAPEISDMIDREFGIETNKNHINSRAWARFRGLTRASDRRLIPPTTSDGEWIYKKPPK